MNRSLSVAAVQAGPVELGSSLRGFADEVCRLAADGAQLIAYPELHLFGTEGHTGERNDLLRENAIPLEDPLVMELSAIARSAQVWLVPGTICERGPNGELFNTALVFSPDGQLEAFYRKVFPWRPSEPYDPGDRFVVFDLMDSIVGISICYYAWFPEMTRHLAWMGADVVLNLVKTTTPDREQEVVLARANAIVNQVFMVSVNCAGPIGRGRSLIVDPEGDVIIESPTDTPQLLKAALDLDHVTRVRKHGTAGENRMWSQFRSDDAPVPLPLYDGRIDPQTWAPHRGPRTP